jgi:TonB family protein
MAASGGDLTQRVVRLVNHHCAPNRDIGKWFAALSVIFSILFMSSQSLFGLSSLAFWSKNQQAQLKTYDPLIQENKFENDDVQELAEYSIAGSLLKNYDEGSISAQVPSQNTYEVALGKQDNIEPIMDNNSLIVPLLVTKVSNDAELTPLSKINKEAHKTSIVSNTEETSTAPLINDNDGVSANKTANIKIARETSKKDNVNKTSSKVASSIKPVKVISEKLSPLKKEEKIAKTKGAATIIKEVVSSPPSPGLMTHNLPNKRVNTSLPMLAETPKSVLMNERHINIGQHNTAQSSITEQHLHALNSQLMKSAIAEQDTLTEYKIVKYNAIETTQEPIRLDAKQLKVVNPVYPSMAKRKGIEIEIEVNFTIDVDGQIKDINFARQNKVNYFKSSIRSAIKQWRFSPAKLNNRPIQSNMSKIFSFNLQS